MRHPVRVAHGLTCYFLAVKGGRYDRWSISEIDESDPRIRERLPEKASQKKEAEQRSVGNGAEDITPEMAKADRSLLQEQMEGVKKSDYLPYIEPKSEASPPQQEQKGLPSNESFASREETRASPTTDLISALHAEFVERFNNNEITTVIPRSRIASFVREHPETREYRAALGCSMTLFVLGIVAGLILLFFVWPLALIILLFCIFPLRAGIDQTAQQHALKTALKSPTFYRDAVSSGMLSVIERSRS